MQNRMHPRKQGVRPAIGGGRSPSMTGGPLVDLRQEQKRLETPPRFGAPESSYWRSWSAS